MTTSPYEILASKFADRSSCVLVYENRRDGRMNYVGAWHGTRDVATESIGPLLRQGLAGFTLEATWKDLVEQLEASGFRQSDASAEDVLFNVADVVRLVFWADGKITCQWFTHGPDDNARSADKPIAVFPSKGRA